jgi:DNA-nicking Smr family endonuclease
MSKPRRPRELTTEERRLWAEVARAIVPLAGRAPVPVSEPDEDAPDPSAAPLEVRARASRPATTLPPLSPLDRKTLVALRRGTQTLDGVIDLHGMRQAEAQQALVTFLHRSQHAGRRLVLVITGKGAASSGEPFQERGVLRRVVPHWLRLPELRRVVVGFEQAAPPHGGAGALYVRLRRPVGDSDR